MTGRKFFPLLVMIGTACGDSPTEVVLPPEPEDVTLTFVMVWSRAGGVEEATVTCLSGCPGRQTLTTDSLGSVTFLSAHPPLAVEVRKLGYITKQLGNLMDKDSVVVSHVWPEESKETFERLLIPRETVLQWGVLERGDGGIRGQYMCLRVLVVEDSREMMLHVLEHELYHAHQGSVAAAARPPGVLPTSWQRPCELGDYTWVDTTEEGKAYAEAWEADVKASRLFPPIDSDLYYQKPIENPAAFYAWWVRSPDGLPNDLCIIATARCQFMEDHYGPRPPGSAASASSTGSNAPAGSSQVRIR